MEIDYDKLWEAFTEIVYYYLLHIFKGLTKNISLQELRTGIARVIKRYKKHINRLLEHNDPKVRNSVKYILNFSLSNASINYDYFYFSLYYIFTRVLFPKVQKLHNTYYEDLGYLIIKVWHISYLLLHHKIEIDVSLIKFVWNMYLGYLIESLSSKAKGHYLGILNTLDRSIQANPKLAVSFIKLYYDSKLNTHVAHCLLPEIGVKEIVSSLPFLYSIFITILQVSNSNNFKKTLKDLPLHEIYLYFREKIFPNPNYVNHIKRFLEESLVGLWYVGYLIDTGKKNLVINFLENSNFWKIFEGYFKDYYFYLNHRSVEITNEAVKKLNKFIEENLEVVEKIKKHLSSLYIIPESVKEVYNLAPIILYYYTIYHGSPEPLAFNMIFEKLYRDFERDPNLKKEIEKGRIDNPIFILWFTESAIERNQKDIIEKLVKNEKLLYAIDRYLSKYRKYLDTKNKEVCDRILKLIDKFLQKNPKVLEEFTKILSKTYTEFWDPEVLIRFLPTIATYTAICTRYPNSKILNAIYYKAHEEFMHSQVLEKLVKDGLVENVIAKLWYIEKTLSNKNTIINFLKKENNHPLKIVGVYIEFYRESLNIKARNHCDNIIKLLDNFILTNFQEVVKEIDIFNKSYALESYIEVSRIIAPFLSFVSLFIKSPQLLFKYFSYSYIIRSLKVFRDLPEKSKEKLLRFVLEHYRDVRDFVPMIVKILFEDIQDHKDILLKVIKVVEDLYNIFDILEDFISKSSLKSKARFLLGLMDILKRPEILERLNRVGRAVDISIRNHIVELTLISEDPSKGVYFGIYTVCLLYAKEIIHKTLPKHLKREIVLKTRKIDKDVIAKFVIKNLEKYIRHLPESVIFYIANNPSILRRGNRTVFKIEIDIKKEEIFAFGKRIYTYNHNINSLIEEAISKIISYFIPFAIRIEREFLEEVHKSMRRTFIEQLGYNSIVNNIRMLLRPYVSTHLEYTVLTHSRVDTFYYHFIPINKNLAYAIVLEGENLRSGPQGERFEGECQVVGLIKIYRDNKGNLHIVNFENPKDFINDIAKSRDLFESGLGKEKLVRLGIIKL